MSGMGHDVYKCHFLNYQKGNAGEEESKQMYRVYLQLVLSMVFVGSNITLGKEIMQEVPVFLFSELRFFIAMLILLSWIAVRKETKNALPGKEWSVVLKRTNLSKNPFQQIHDLNWTNHPGQ